MLRPTRTLFLGTTLVVVGLTSSSGAIVGAGPPTASTPTPFVCPVTIPTPRNVPANFPINHGDGAALATSVWSPVVFKPGGPGCVASDGSLVIKWGWWRGVPGQLAVTGRGLDGRPGVVRTAYPPYGRVGFQPSALAFPGPGCWEVSARVAEARLSFVVLVEKIAEGPRAPCESLFGRTVVARLDAARSGAAR